MTINRSRLAVALLVALVCPTTFSAPATRSTCTPVCKRSHESKLNYLEGKTYTYGFETEVNTQVVGSSDESSKIKVKGQALIAAQSECDFVLTVQQVAIQSPSGQAISRVDDIEGSSLRFAYQNGEIESVCVSDDDPTWSANVKRAIISMLTNKANRDNEETVEEDISGRCPTSYVVEGDRYIKTRNLNSCTHRDGGGSIFLGVAYEVPSKYNSLPVVSSTLTCTQEISSSIFQSISCTEDHSLALLSSSTSGVQTQIKSSLNLISTSDSLVRGSKSASLPSSIYYDHSSSKQDSQRRKTSVSRASDYLGKICQEVESGSVSSKVPGLHLQLIKSLKSAKKDEVKLLYQQTSTMCPKGTEKLQKLFLDACATSASDGAIALLAELIVAEQLDQETIAKFNSYTIFASRPGTQALEALETLISREDSDPSYLLTASAVAHQYCQLTDAKCSANNEYHSLVDKIAQHVRSPSKDDELATRKVIAALHALGNLDQLTPTAIQAITNLLNDKETSERVKVRALDAFRRDPCQPELKRKAMKILGKVKESSQVRIQAYLSVAKCLLTEDLDSMQTILDQEKSNQVGSFVTSHIENILKTSSPGKQDLRSVFRQLNLPTEFSGDSRKFSRNVEFSTFTDMNLGGSLEGNMIFSQDSYLPRTLDANLTLDAFGRSYNLLEMGLYAEDFEHIVEKFFGPSGKLSQKSIDSFMIQSKNKLSNLVEGVRSRWRRDVKTTSNLNEISEIREKVDISERTDNTGKADMYLRVMGTSILVESYNTDEFRPKSLTVGIRKALERAVEGAKEHKFDLTEPLIFIDEEVSVPTSSGLPLNLELKGSSILSLQMNGNLDIPALVRGEGMADMRAKVIPSAATLIKARMTVGTGPIESGIQIEGKIHSEAGVDMKIVKEDGKFEVRFNLPQDKTQIIDMRSDLYWVEQPPDSLEKKTPVQSKLQTKSIVDNECVTSLSKVLGLKMCADFKLPSVSRAAPFPMLNGQSVFSLSIEKSEPSMEGYYLKVEKSPEDTGSFGVDFLFDTPGSRTLRKVSASFKGLQYRSSTPEYKFKLDSPWTQLDVEYKRSLTDDLKGINLKVNSDGQLYMAKAALKKVSAGSVQKYEPFLQYQLPGGKTVKLIEGQVVLVESQNRMEIDVRSAGPMKALKGYVKGALELPVQSEGYKFVAKDLEISSEPLGKLSVDGYFAAKKRFVDTSVQLKYGGNGQHTMDFETKLGSTKQGQFELKTKSRSSLSNFLNFDVLAELVKTQNSYKSDFSYSRGAEDPKVRIEHKFDAKVESRREFEVLNEVTLKHPELQVDIYSKFDSKARPGEKRHAEFIFNANTLKANAKYESSGQNLLDYDVKAKIDYSNKLYEFSEVSTKVEDKKQNFKTRISVTPGFWYAADTDVAYKFEKSDIESFIESKITSDQLDQPIIFKSGLKGKSDGYTALMKLDAKGQNYLDLNTKFKHSKGSQPTSLDTKAFVRNYLDATITHQISRTESDLKIDLRWTPTNRKIEAVSKFQVQGNVYNLNSNLKWDAEKNPMKSVGIVSITSVSSQGWGIDSKNDLTFEGQLSKLNLKGKLSDGDGLLELGYVSPDSKSYNLASTLSLENKTKAKGAKVNLKVTLPENPKPFDLTWESRVSNMDSHERTFDAVTDFKFDYRGEKEIKLRFEAGSTLPGNYRSFIGKAEAGGSILPEPMNAEVKADIKTGKWAVKGSSSKGTRKGDFDIVIEYDRWAPKKTLGIKYTVNTPFELVKSVSLQQKYGFLFNSFKNFELSDEGSFVLNNGHGMQWEVTTMMINNEFNHITKVVNDPKDGQEKQVYSLAANGKLTGKKFISGVETIIKGSKSFVTLEVDHELPNLGLDMKGASPENSFELKVSHQKTGDSVYETDVLAKTQQELAFRLTNKVELSAQKKSIDLMLSSTQEPTRRLYLLLNKAQANKYNVEALVRWGDDTKYLSTKGDLSRKDDGFDATLSLESPEFKSQKMQLKLNKKSNNGRHTMDLKIQEGSKNKFTAEVDFGQVKSGHKTEYDGSLKVKGDKNILDIDFNSKFHMEDNSLSRSRGDNEEGRQVRASLELMNESPIKLSAILKTSDLEKRAQLSFCHDEQGCRTGDAHFRHQHDNNGDLEYSFRLVGENSAKNGEKSSTGISLRTSLAENGRQLDHTVKLILNKNSEQVGYRFYRKDGHELGAEILLPERVIATVLDFEHPKPTDVKIDLSFYIDKTKQPKRKISVIFNTLRHQRSAGIERDVEIVFKHPDVNKDLKVKTKYIIWGESDQFLDVKTELDVFKAGSEILMAYKIKKEQDLFKTEWSVKSEGQEINFGGKSEISNAQGQFSYKQELHYENRERQMITAKVEALLTPQRMSFEVEGQSKKLISLISTFDSNPTGYEHKNEILMPWMDDARILQAKLTTTSPTRAQVKAYTSSSPPGVYYEAFLGFKNDDHFVAGLYDHESDGKKVLADFNMALNNSRILFVKTDWERNNIKNVWTKAQARVDRHGKNLKEIAVSSGEEIIKELQFVSTNLRKSSPGLKVIFTTASDDLTALETELNGNEDTKIIMDNYYLAKTYLKKYLKFVFEVTRIVRRMSVQAISAARVHLTTTVPELWKEYSEQLPYSLEDIQEYFDQWVTTLVSVTRKGVKLVSQAIQKIEESIPEIIKKVNWALDLTSEASDCLKKLLEKGLDFGASWWRKLRAVAADLVDNQFVQMVLKDVVKTGQIMLTEFIEETKNHAESFKNYVIQAIPERDFQEIVQLSAEYIEKKARGERVDDVEAVKEIFDKMVKLVKKVGAEFFTIDTSDGIMIAKIPLPVPIMSLSELWKVFDSLRIPSPPKFSYNLPSVRFGIKETVNKLKNGASINEIVPPFDAYALIIGSQHYKTFDGKFYRFDGNCQYLLASDFEDGNFTVVLDYDKTGSSTKKALIVSDKQDTIAIKPDSTVEINGRQVTLTGNQVEETNSFKIERKHDWIVISGDKGVKVGCSVTQDVCGVKVSGFYHGKVMGMLGKFNQELYDEWSTPDGEIADTVNDFAKSWKIENSCTEQPMVYLPMIPSQASERCAAAFESNYSQLRPCYGVVGPRDYQSICESLSSAPGYDVSKAVCTSATGYAKACKLSFAKVDHLEDCPSV